MQETYQQLTEELNLFWYASEELRLLQDTNEQEILLTNRIIKKEVLDMADLMEQMYKTMNLQNERIEYLVDKLEDKEEHRQFKTSLIKSSSMIDSE